MTTDQQANPFASADAWETSTDTLLTAGNHRVRIVEAKKDVAGTKNPQVVLKFENANGTIRAWETYHKEFLSKVVAIYDSADIERPQVGEFDPETFELTEACVGRLLGKEIGIVVRDELDERPDKAGQTQTRVKGYVKAAEITSSGGRTDVPQTGPAAAALASAPGGGTLADEDIPF